MSVHTQCLLCLIRDCCVCVRVCPVCFCGSVAVELTTNGQITFFLTPSHLLAPV